MFSFGTLSSKPKPSSVCGSGPANEDFKRRLQAEDAETRAPASLDVPSQIRLRRTAARASPSLGRAGQAKDAGRPGGLQSGHLGARPQGFSLCLQPGPVHRWHAAVVLAPALPRRLLPPRSLRRLLAPKPRAPRRRRRWRAESARSRQLPEDGCAQGRCARLHPPRRHAAVTPRNWPESLGWRSFTS